MADEKISNALNLMAEKSNGYPLDFRIVNIVSDALDGRYFPATIAHIISIRNMTDEELIAEADTYRVALADRANRSRYVHEFVGAVLKVAADEYERRKQFKSGTLTLEDYYPEVYDGNVPKIVEDYY